MPSLYYQETFSIPGGGKVLLVVLDTNTIVDGDTKQLSWLTQTLCNSSARWKFVAGHHPVYSGGSHGSNFQMLRDVKPLLQRCHVDVYFCGHDHTLQHLFEGGTHHIVSGGGSDTGSVIPIAQTVFAKESTGFSLHRVSFANMETEIVDQDGTVLHKFLISKNSAGEGISSAKPSTTQATQCRDRYKWKCQARWCSSRYWQQKCEKTCLLCKSENNVADEATSVEACIDEYEHRCRKAWCTSDYWRGLCKETCGLC